MPKILGEGANTTGVYATRKIEEVFIKAQEYADNFKDSYISAEHVMLAIIDIEDKRVIGSILKSFDIDFILLPDISENLDGVHKANYERLPSHGTSIEEIKMMAGEKPQ
jgi:ATP-dependent Clp protease ATP-binding subunit ClpA